MDDKLVENKEIKSHVESVVNDETRTMFARETKKEMNKNLEDNLELSKKEVKQKTIEEYKELEKYTSKRLRKPVGYLEPGVIDTPSTEYHYKNTKWLLSFLVFLILATIAVFIFISATDVDKGSEPFINRIVNYFTNESFTIPTFDSYNHYVGIGLGLTLLTIIISAKLRIKTTLVIWNKGTLRWKRGRTSFTVNLEDNLEYSVIKGKLSDTFIIGSNRKVKIKKRYCKGLKEVLDRYI